jgi:hypothetical protein
MIGQFFGAVVVGAAIGVALCAMTDSPFVTWVNQWGKYRWGRLCLSVAGLFAATGFVVIGGAIFGFGFVLSVNAYRLNQEDNDQ